MRSGNIRLPGSRCPLRILLWRPSTTVIIVYIGLFLLYAVVLRNLPGQPFAWFNIPNLD